MNILDRRRFLIQRLAKLYPAYLPGLVLMVPFAFGHQWGTQTASFGDARLRWKVLTAALHLGMAHVWFPRFVCSWNVPDLPYVRSGRPQWSSSSASR